MVARLSIPTGHTDTEQLPQELDGNNGEEHSNAEDDEDDDNPDEKVYNGTITKPKQKGKQRRKWVKKLLNQSATPQIHKDRVYRTTRKHPHYVRHCRHHRGLLPPPQMLTVANALHVHCVAHILGFLDTSEPARTCAYVNKALAASVRVFYETYCSHPRPQRFLVQRLFQNDSIVRDILGWLSPVERVRVNASCQSFYHAANALPLEITGSQSAAQFVHYLARERVETRFEATKELHLENMHADEAMNVVRFLDTDDESECFQALTTLSLRRIRGFEDDQQSFEQLIQVLFTDRVSRRLHTLELSDLGLEDSHYKYLATLFYDARFPSLRYLNLSRNQFSSRFMRDWRRSFVNERFEKLQTLDITGASCA
uniref:F-box domain-containing protein n=1 Tax=Globisporangium ultimum (strain ATCC 200006 / CBS 805.95 / DAOM BR144) TaxID=431595 RepID=K3WPH8_GLOUD